MAETISVILSFLQFASFFLVTLFTLLTVINLFTVRTIKRENAANIAERVAILIPMRNESKNVAGILESVENQIKLENFEILVLDDHSDDDTNSLLKTYANKNLRVIEGAPLPTGWLGKNFACHQLANNTDAEYLVFLDADLRLAPEAISASIKKMQDLGWDFISPYPKQIALSPMERLVQPLLQWSWFASVPLRLAERLRLTSMAVANGQFFIVKASVYFKVGGHEAIKAEVIDDVELARSLIREKFQGFVGDGSKIAHCRMYQSAGELITGYAKSQWRAFGNLFGSAVMVLILTCVSIIPLTFALAGSKYGLLGYFAITGTRLLVARKTGSSLYSALFHPISALVWIVLIKYSWIQKWRGKLIWKSRAV